MCHKGCFALWESQEDSLSLSQKAHGGRDALATGVGCTWRRKKGTRKLELYYHQIVHYLILDNDDTEKMKMTKQSTIQLPKTTAQVQVQEVNPSLAGQLGRDERI